MLGKLALIMMLLCVAASATDIIYSGIYKFTFDLPQPMYGMIFEEAANNLTVKGIPYIGWMNVNGMQADIYKTHTDAYICVPQSRDYYIGSTMNLTDTIDFLKSLKVEKVKA